MIAARATSTASAQAWSRRAVRAAVLVTWTFFRMAGWGAQTGSAFTPRGSMPTYAHGNDFRQAFRDSARGSTVPREVRGGPAIFFTMAYLVVLNPLILGDGHGLHGR